MCRLAYKALLNFNIDEPWTKFGLTKFSHDDCKKLTGNEFLQALKSQLWGIIILYLECIVSAVWIVLILYLHMTGLYILPLVAKVHFKFKNLHVPHRSSHLNPHSRLANGAMCTASCKL